MYRTTNNPDVIAFHFEYWHSHTKKYYIPIPRNAFDEFAKALKNILEIPPEAEFDLIWMHEDLCFAYRLKDYDDFNPLMMQTGFPMNFSQIISTIMKAYHKDQTNDFEFKKKCDFKHCACQFQGYQTVWGHHIFHLFLQFYLEYNKKSNREMQQWKFWEELRKPIHVLYAMAENKEMNLDELLEIIDPSDFFIRFCLEDGKMRPEFFNVGDIGQLNQDTLLDPNPFSKCLSSDENPHIYIDRELRWETDSTLPRKHQDVDRRSRKFKTQESPRKELKWYDGFDEFGRRKYGSIDYDFSNEPKGFVTAAQCICGRSYFKSWVTSYDDDGDFDWEDVAVTETLWDAITAIFEQILPDGQARVVGKIMGERFLDSSERTIKFQLKKKLKKFKEIAEFWDDLKNFA